MSPILNRGVRRAAPCLRTMGVPKSRYWGQFALLVVASLLMAAVVAVPNHQTAEATGNSNGFAWGNEVSHSNFVPTDVAATGTGFAISGGWDPDVQNAVGGVRLSTDGITWTVPTTGPGDENWRALAFGNGTLVVVGSSEANLSTTVEKRISYSTDGGETWTGASLSGNELLKGTLRDVVYVNSRFVAVGSRDSNWVGSHVLTSQDGISWSAATGFNAVTGCGGPGAPAGALVCGAPLTVIAADSESTVVAISETGNKVLRSTDAGLTWSIPADQVSSPIFVSHNGSRFLIHRFQSDYVATSDDGNAWTTHLSSELWRSLWLGNQYVGFSPYLDGLVYFSDDGVNWSDYWIDGNTDNDNDPSNPNSYSLAYKYNGIAVGSGRVVAVASAGSVGKSIVTLPAAILPATQQVSGTVGTDIEESTGFTKSNFSGDVTYSSETLPAGLTLDIKTGVISGRPTAVSTATVTITATGAPTGTATATVTFAISAAQAPTDPVVIVPPAPETTAPPAPTTTAPGNVPTLVSADNQAALTRTPGSATALVNGQPVEVEVFALADSAGAQTAPEDRTPEQVAELQQAAEAVAERLAAVAGGDIGIEVIATDTGAELSGVFPDRNVPVEDVIVVDVGESATLFAARSASGDIIEVQPGAVLEVTPEGEVAVIAYGLPVGDQVELVLMSTPTLLGTFIVDASGAIETLANIPDAIGSGDHTLVVASPNVQASLGLKVSDLTGSGAGAQSSERTLPAAGSSPVNGLVIILLAMGGLLVLAARRRREMVID
jgi:hypothetical protein